jgi:hypothetical protein
MLDCNNSPSDHFKMSDIVVDTRVGKNPGFFKKTQPGGFFWVFWVLLGFIGFFWVLLGFLNLVSVT